MWTIEGDEEEEVKELIGVKILIQNKLLTKVPVLLVQKS